MARASTVAVVVPSPATSEVLEATSRTSWAPMFSCLSLSSISLATVTPSLVMSGEPNFFSMRTLRPFGAEGDLHRVGELVHAAQDRLAGVFGIDDGLGSHVCVSLVLEWNG